MKLKEYANQIQKLVASYPDLEVFYSTDYEGNGFEPVYFLPDVGTIAQGTFYTKSDASRIKNAVINAICIN